MFFFLISTGGVHADIFIDSQESIKENTDALVEVLEKSVVPGGTRSVQINGSDLRVRRYANPLGDDSEFYEVWKHAEARKAEANNEILSVLEKHDPVYSAFTKDIPYSSLKNNVAKLMNLGEGFAQSQAGELKTLVIDAVETPFTYETNQYRVIASIPIKSINADSSLSREESKNGYLFMSAKKPGTTVSDAFWQMEFGEEFNFADLFGKNGRDVNGEDSDVARYPGSKMTMAFSEKANDWDSQSWSYESNGDVLSHISHYIDAFKIAGFGKESHSVVRSDYGLVQFANRREQATLFVELVDPRDQSVQVTLQVRGN